MILLPCCLIWSNPSITGQDKNVYSAGFDYFAPQHNWAVLQENLCL